MPSDKESKKQFNQMVVSIQLFRSRKRNQSVRISTGSQVNRAIDQLIHQRVIRELHDGLSQTVSALAMRINFARRCMDADPVVAQRELEKVEDLVRDTTREIRHMIFMLRSIQVDSLELTTALQILVEKMGELFELEIDLSISDDLVNQLPVMDQRVIYAIVEEAIDSARKRNGSKRLAVRLDKLERQVARLEIENSWDISSQAEQPFQGQELESIQKFSELINGSVKIESNGNRMQILFPLSELMNKGTQASL